MGVVEEIGRQQRTLDEFEHDAIGPRAIGGEAAKLDPLCGGVVAGREIDRRPGRAAVAGIGANGLEPESAARLGGFHERKGVAAAEPGEPLGEGEEGERKSVSKKEGETN